MFSPSLNPPFLLLGWPGHEAAGSPRPALVNQHSAHWILSSARKFPTFPSVPAPELCLVLLLEVCSVAFVGLTSCVLSLPVPPWESHDLPCPRRSGFFPPHLEFPVLSHFYWLKLQSLHSGSDLLLYGPLLTLKTFWWDGTKKWKAVLNSNVQLFFNECLYFMHLCLTRVSACTRARAHDWKVRQMLWETSSSPWGISLPHEKNVFFGCAAVAAGPPPLSLRDPSHSWATTRGFISHYYSYPTNIARVV